MDGSTGAEASATTVRKAAPYLFLGQTTSLCETCLALVPTKVIAEDEAVYYLKRCREHGVQKTLVADDLAYWKSQRDWLKPGERPLSVATRTEHGCPYDCGLCPDHEQHSCLAIIEVNQACNLSDNVLLPRKYQRFKDKYRKHIKSYKNVLTGTIPLGYGQR